MWLFQLIDSNKSWLFTVLFRAFICQSSWFITYIPGCQKNRYFDFAFQHFSFSPCHGTCMRLQWVLFFVLVMNQRLKWCYCCHLGNPLHWFTTCCTPLKTRRFQVCYILMTQLAGSPQTQPAFPFLLRQWGNFHCTSMCKCECVSLSCLCVCVCSCSSCSWWAPDGYAGRQLLLFWLWHVSEQPAGPGSLHHTFPPHPPPLLIQTPRESRAGLCLHLLNLTNSCLIYLVKYHWETQSAANNYYHDR